MNLAEFRQKYPQYQDISDGDLSRRLHEKYYADQPFDSFAQSIGYTAESEEAPRAYAPMPKEPSQVDVWLEKLQGMGKAFGVAPEPEAAAPDMEPMGAQAMAAPMDLRSLLPKDYGQRENGTAKGKGWLGEIPMQDGRVMTEMSIGVSFDGKEELIPAIVPTLTKDELSHLANGGKVTDSIADKAVEHAKMRIRAGLSPFVDEKPAPGTPDMSGDPGTMQISPAEQLRSLLGTGEAAANLATVPVGLAVGGGRALFEAAKGSDLKTISEEARKKAEEFTYSPRTEAGQQIAGAAMAPFEKLSEFDDALAQKVYDNTGNAFIAAMMGSAPELLLAGAPFISRLKLGRQGMAKGSITPEEMTAGMTEGQRLRNLAKEYGPDSPEFKAAFEDSLSKRMGTQDPIAPEAPAAPAQAAPPVEPVVAPPAVRSPEVAPVAAPFAAAPPVVAPVAPVAPGVPPALPETPQMAPPAARPGAEVIPFPRATEQAAPATTPLEDIPLTDLDKIPVADRLRAMFPDMPDADVQAVAGDLQRTIDRGKIPPAAEDSPYPTEIRTAVDRVVTDLAPRVGVKIDTIDYSPERILIDPTTPEGLQRAREVGIEEGEIQNAIESGEKFQIFGEHKLSGGEGGERRSTITLFQDATPEDVFHEFTHAVDEQGGLPGWKGKPEERAGFLSKEIAAGREESFPELTKEGSRLGGVAERTPVRKADPGSNTTQDAINYSVRLFSDSVDVDYPAITRAVWESKPITAAMSSGWRQAAKKAGASPQAITTALEKLKNYNKIRTAGSFVMLPEVAPERVVIREGVLNTPAVEGQRRERLDKVYKGVDTGVKSVEVGSLFEGGQERTDIPKEMRGLKPDVFLNVPITQGRLQRPKPLGMNYPLVVTGNPHIKNFKRPHPSWDQSIKAVRIKPVSHGNAEVTQAVVSAIKYAKEVGAKILITSFRAKQPWVLASFTGIVPTDPANPEFSKYWKENPNPKPTDSRKFADWTPYVPKGEWVSDAFRKNGWDIEKNIYGTGGTWWWPKSRELDPAILKAIGKTPVEYCDLMHKGCPSCRNCQKLTYPESAGAPIVGVTDEPFCEHGCPQCFVRLGQSGVGGRQGISIGQNAKQAGFGEKDLGDLYKNTINIMQKVARPAGVGRADYVSKFMRESPAGKVDMAISLYLDGKITPKELDVIRGEISDEYGDIIQQIPVPDKQYSVRRVPAEPPAAKEPEKAKEKAPAPAEGVKAIGQKRAKVGGEFGANGEWYEGGKFIATTDRAKQQGNKWKKPTGKQLYEPGKWDVPPETADNIIAVSLFRQLGGIETSKPDGSFSLNPRLSGELATPEAIAARQARVNAWNDGGRWALVSVDESGKRTPLNDFMDHSGNKVSSDIGGVTGNKPPRSPGKDTEAMPAGNVQPQGPTQPAVFSKPIPKGQRRSETIKAVEKKLGLPIRFGKFRGPFAGIYKKKAEVVRLKKANDIGVAAHEVAHHVQDLIGLGGTMPPEVQAMAYAGAKNLDREGFAEFVRYYITDMPKVQREAPGFMATFDAALDQHPDVADAFTRIKESWNAWQAADPVQKIASIIRRGKDDKQRYTLNELYRDWVDELHPVQLLSEAIQKRSPAALAAIDNPYMMAWLTRGWARKAEQMLKYGTFQMDEAKGVKFTGKSLREILKPIERAGEMEELDVYLVSKRAMNDERILKGFEGVLPGENFVQAVERLEPKYGEIGKELYKFQDEVLTYLTESGRISQEMADSYRKQNAFYAPLYRVMDDAPPSGRIGAGKYSEIGNPAKRLKGSSRDILSPVENIIKNTFAFVNAAERNRVGQAILKATEVQGMGDMVERIPFPLEPQKILKEDFLRLLKQYGDVTAIRNVQVTQTQTERALGQMGAQASPSTKLIKVAKEALERRGFSPAEADQIIERIKATPVGPDRQDVIEKTVEKTVIMTIKEELGFGRMPDQVLHTFRPAYRAGPSEAIFYDDGKPVLVEMSKDLASAVKGMDADGVNLLVKILALPAKLLRAGATLTPEFGARNPVRDQISAFVFSKYGYIPGWDMVRGLYHLLKVDDVYKKYNASGAAQADLVSLDRNYLSLKLEQIQRMQTPGEAARHPVKAIKNFVFATAKNPLKVMQIINEITEEMTRVGGFAKGLKTEGGNLEALLRAAIEGRDMTLDFKRKGAKVLAMNMMTAFFNANLQGTNKMYRAFKERPGQTFLKAFLGLTVPSLLLYYSQHDDPYYEEIPRWRKILFWNIITHNEDGSLNHIWSIPKPFEIGILFATVPIMALEWMKTNDPKGFKETMIAAGQALLPGVIPTAATPWIENLANRSLFFDRPISPRGSEDLSPWLQYSERTSEAMKLAAKGLKDVPFLKEYANPAKMENVVRGYTGGLGGYTLQEIDRILKATGAVTVAPAPTMKLEDLPLIKGFSQRWPTANAQSIEDFYEKYMEAKRKWADRQETSGINRARTAFSAIGEQLTLKSGDKIALGMPPELASMEGVAKMLTVLRNNAKVTKASQTATPDQKQEQLDRIYLAMTNLARGALGKQKLK